MQDVIKAYNVDIVKEYTSLGLLGNKEDPFKDKYPKGWEHAIIIETTERHYRLFAKEYSFKELFLFVLTQLLMTRDKEKEKTIKEQFAKIIEEQSSS